MEEYRYSESGQLNSIYKKHYPNEPEQTTEIITRFIRDKMEFWQGACKEVIDRGELDIHEYNALYDLYKDMAIWYLMEVTDMIDAPMLISRREAGSMIENFVPDYISNVYGTNALLHVADEKAMVAGLACKTSYAPNILREAFWDAKVDMMRWCVAEKLAEYGYMN